VVRHQFRQLPVTEHGFRVIPAPDRVSVPGFAIPVYEGSQTDESRGSLEDSRRGVPAVVEWLAAGPCLHQDAVAGLPEVVQTSPLLPAVRVQFEDFQGAAGRFLKVSSETT